MLRSFILMLDIILLVILPLSFCKPINNRVKDVSMPVPIVAWIPEQDSALSYWLQDTKENE